MTLAQWYFILTIFLPHGEFAFAPSGYFASFEACEQARAAYREVAPDDYNARPPATTACVKAPR